MAGMGVATGAFTFGGRAGTLREEGSPVEIRRVPLRVQPVLVFETPERREGTSWRNWGGLHNAADLQAEQERIRKELAGLEKGADFPLRIEPLVSVKTLEEAHRVVAGQYDLLVMYAAGGGVRVLEALTDPNRWTIMFLRHRSGPVYLWYEIASNRFLRKTVDEFGQPGVTVRDVVVDRTDGLLWRMRSLAALKNTRGKKILCIGGASGWGHGGDRAPELTRDKFGMDLVDITYEELGRRLEASGNRRELVQLCNEEADRYMASEGIHLETSAEFIRKAFLLTEVFKDLMVEHETDALTINLCMGTIMEVSGTTGCLSLTLLNDSGCMAFCESDFVVIPSGVLLHYISGKPVFLNDPTYAHDGLVTLAHCTAPRKMDGVNPEKTRLMTHFESDWGVAPKVDMRLGQKLTVIDPDFNFARWMGFEAEVAGNPNLDICRSQIDVAFKCDTDRLNEETRGFHWMACYGDYLKETEYAVRKAGLDWLTLA